MKKMPKHLSDRSETLQEAGVDTAVTTVCVRLQEQNYGMQTTRQLQNRIGRLQFAKKYLKEPFEFWKKDLLTDETKIYCIRVMARTKCGGQKDLPKIQSTPHPSTPLSCETWWSDVMVWACMAATGTGSRVLIDYVTTDSNRS